MVVGVSVTVRGVEEVERAFDATARDIPKATRAAEGDTVRKIVSEARGLVPKVDGSTAASLTSQGATITMGTIGLQVVDFRGVKGGRYLYPTIGRHGREIAERAGDATLSAAKDHGFEVHQ